MLLILLVGIGGFFGAVMRYLVTEWFQDIFRASSLPYGTITVNITGCLLIGLLAGLSENRNLLSPETRALLLVGVLGGFTTFSAFSYETVDDVLYNPQHDYTKKLLSAVPRIRTGT